MSGLCVLTCALAAMLTVTRANVIENPRDNVVLHWVTARFTCRGSAGTTQLHLDNRLIINPSSFFPDTRLEQQFMERNFSWSMSTSGSTKWVVDIVASPANNGSTVRCFFGNSASATAVLVAVNGPPGPPAAPTVTVTELDALTIRWTAPWPHPVSNYTLILVNTSSGQETHFSTEDDQFMLLGEGREECVDDLEFRVEAMTQVGGSGVSPSITAGFPRAIGPVDNRSLELQLKTVFVSGSPAVSVMFKPPEVCNNQTLSYEYLLAELNTTNATITENSTSSSITLQGDLILNEPYQLNLTINNNVWESITISEIFTFGQNMVNFEVSATSVFETSSPEVTQQHTSLAMDTIAVTSKIASIPSTATTESMPVNTINKATTSASTSTLPGPSVDPLSQHLPVIISCAAVVAMIFIIVFVIAGILIVSSKTKGKMNMAAKNAKSKKRENLYIL